MSASGQIRARAECAERIQSRALNGTVVEKIGHIRRARKKCRENAVIDDILFEINKAR